MTRQRHSLSAASRLAALTALAAIGVLSCATTTDPQGPGKDPGPTEEPMIGTAAAIQLCDMLRADVGNWDQQNTTLAKATFNGVVHNWALRNGAVNVSVARHRQVVDAAAAQHCPDVRDQVTHVLDIPDLASGLAGF
ncbi:hypothetical protein BOX37_12585 [Nocardia mangyaensis]|uniref:DUF732 domain-containing protein n=1 Tax=Nocardia mangyaensis TaxID=2213200 RepID=A0A1J0VRJ8_9NOCA|nr:hypothetical protein [Nocardia mangyaensis]APE34654.1 hypothetical protein BOX37_12585 [Nocardia mangyaensis]